MRTVAMPVAGRAEAITARIAQRVSAIARVVGHRVFGAHRVTATIAISLQAQLVHLHAARDARRDGLGLAMHVVAARARGGRVFAFQLPGALGLCAVERPIGEDDATVAGALQIDLSVARIGCAGGRDCERGDEHGGEHGLNLHGVDLRCLRGGKQHAGA